VVSLLSVPANSYDTFDDHTLLGGVSSRQYYLTASAVANIETATLAGVGNWNASAAPVNWTIASEANGEVVFNWVQSNATDACALTYWWYDGVFHSYPEQNWNWSKVNIRSLIKNPDYCGPTGHRQGIVAHELGHAMGLAHVFSRPAMIMYVWVADTSVNDPGDDDIEGIKHLYQVRPPKLEQLIPGSPHEQADPHPPQHSRRRGRSLRNLSLVVLQRQQHREHLPGQ